MRKIALFLMLAVLPAMAMTGVASAATSQPAGQELLVKKKKAEEAKKAAEAKKAEEAKKSAEAKKAKEKKAAEAKKAAEKKAAEAKKAAEKKKAAEARKAAEKKRLAEKKKREERIALARREQEKKAQSVVRAPKDCDGFLECMFGKPRRGVVRASTGGAALDLATGEDIDWAPAAKYAPGSIVVQTPERALYLVTGNGEARRYKVGVGREGFQWSGTGSITNKAEWPTWRPPAEMIKREAAKGHILPAEMAGGPQNPLGARALYIGSSIYRIHGTNSPDSIGGAVSSGCIRMMNSDVIDLYDRVKVGARVYVYQ